MKQKPILKWEVKIGMFKGAYVAQKIGFCDKNMAAWASGCRTRGRARIQTHGVVAGAAARGGKYDKNLAVKNPDWGVVAIGPNLYRATVMILREIGHYSIGGKINSRGTAYGECGPMDGNESEEGKTVHINGWSLAINVGIPSHVFVAHLAIFDIHMGITREQEGRM